MTAPIASGWSESPGRPCTHWKAPPCHGARRNRPFREVFSKLASSSRNRRVARGRGLGGTADPTETCLSGNMTGAVHVLDPKEKLPHKQAFYDDQAKKRQTELLSDGASLEDQATTTEQERHGEHQHKSEMSQGSGDAVTSGIGEIVATGGGSDTVSVMRFLQDSIVVRVGDTVEWTNLDPVTPHTVTFGFAIEPAPPQPPSDGVSVDTDGARHAVLASPADLHSGFLVAALQDRGPPPPPPPALFPAPLAQSPLSVTRFRVTFTKPGTFNYRCILHDDLGMVGQVIVQR